MIIENSINLGLFCNRCSCTKELSFAEELELGEVCDPRGQLICTEDGVKRWKLRTILNSSLKDALQQMVCCPDGLFGPEEIIVDENEECSSTPGYECTPEHLCDPNGEVRTSFGQKYLSSPGDPATAVGETITEPLEFVF